MVSYSNFLSIREKPMTYLRKLFFLFAACLILPSCSSQHIMGNPFGTASASSHAVMLQGFPTDPSFWQANSAVIWDNLQHIPLSQLQSGLGQVSDKTAQAWINLAIISKQYSTDTTQLTTQVIAWRAQNASHPANSLIPDDSTLTSLKTQNYPKHFALLLPLKGGLGSSGQAVRDGFLSAYYQAAPGIKNQQTVSFYDTSSTSNIAALYQKAIAEGADAVIGPLSKEEVQAVLQTGNFPVTTVALNYTDLWFGSLPQHFYEFGLSPVDETKQLADHAWQAGHKRAIIIAPQNDWGQRVSKTLTSEWQGLGGSVADTYYFSSQADLNQGIANLLHVNAAQHNKTNDKKTLEQERRQDFNVIFLLAHSNEARQIVPLLKFYYADNIPIYATSAVYSGKPSAQDSDLNGVNFNDIPWVLGASKGNSNRLYAVGRDAHLIADQIRRLDEMPNFPLYGATGALTLTPQHQIYRRLPWAQMHDGHL